MEKYNVPSLLNRTVKYSTGTGMINNAYLYPDGIIVEVISFNDGMEYRFTIDEVEILD